MPQDITVAEFFERIVPEQFAALMADADDEITGQPDLHASYEIIGEGGGVYGLRFSGSALEIVPGGFAESDLHTVVSIEHWQLGIPGLENDIVVEYVRRGKVELIKGLKGAFKLDLNRAEGANYTSAMIFGGSEEPEVVIFMDIDDYAAMARGDLNGQMAFMTGKLKFEGSLPLLMQLGALNS